MERVFGDHADVQRCQFRKRQKLKEYLPESWPGTLRGSTPGFEAAGRIAHSRLNVGKHASSY